MNQIEYMREYYRKNKEHIRALQRANYLKNREYRIAQAKAWKEANREAHLKQCRKQSAKQRKDMPLQVRARLKVSRAVRRGELQRSPCQICGTLPTEAHHEDYTKPLTVMWLCRKHHKLIHRKYK